MWTALWLVLLLALIVVVIVLVVLSYRWAKKDGGCCSSSSSCCRSNRCCSSSSSSSSTGIITGDTAGPPPTGPDPGSVPNQPPQPPQPAEPEEPFGVVPTDEPVPERVGGPDPVPGDLDGDGVPDIRSVLQSFALQNVSYVAPLMEARGSRVKGQYIVLFKHPPNSKGILASSQHLGQMVRSHVSSLQCDTMHEYSDVFPGMSVRNVSKTALEQLRRDSRVAAITEDGVVEASVWSRDDLHQSAICDCPNPVPVPPAPAPAPSPPAPPSAPPVPPPGSTQTIGWTIPRVGGQKSSWTIGDANSVVSIDIYILDTGRPTHPDINVVEGVTFVPGSVDPTDKNGHSTHVAGIAAASDNMYGVVGTAPGARIHAVQVLDALGSGAFSTVIAGVNFVMNRKKAKPSVPIVANMSLGAQVNTTAYNALDQAVANAINSGVIFCLAAGNSSANSSLTSPAHVSTAITVGAINQAGKFSTFSNYGPSNTVEAPGEAIQSTWLSGQYATLSGTSMATPCVAGIVAAYLSKNPSATPAQVKAWLIAASAPSSANPAVQNVPANTTNRNAWMGSI